MAKKIEIISASDPQSLKTVLQEMVNEGWEIKGIVGYNPHNIYSEPFVILELLIIDEPLKDEEFYENEPTEEEKFYTQPEPQPQEISISMGGD